MTVQARYHGDDIRVTFEAETERCDYGVRGSSQWEELRVETIKVTSLTILDVTVNFDALKVALPELAKAIHNLHFESHFE